jgi:rapamycin-insensitive companion of mTOR
MAPEYNVASSVMPSQSRPFASYHVSRKSDDGIPRISKDGRSYSSSSIQYGPRGSSLATGTVTGAGPGSFSTDLKTTAFPRTTTPRPELAMSRATSNGLSDDDPITQSEQRQAAVRDKIAKEMKIKLGTENMLEALQSKNAKQSKEQRQKVELELDTSKRKLHVLHQELNQEIQRAQTPTTPPRKRMSSYFRGSPLKSPPVAPDLPGPEPPVDSFEGESPSLVLTEILQALEVEGMQPDYYIERANILVELFKRHPTLKYDLVWSVFSLRVQMMLLSESTGVVAAGYRLTRYAIADRSSLKTIRALHTDEIVILSLVKKSNAVLEREQAVKFVRAFLDVKDGVLEVSRAVVRALVAVAEQHDDRLHHICILTLAEILIRDPPLLIDAGGLNALTEILSEGTFHAPESLVVGFLRLLDTPHQRAFLKSGREIETIFGPLTDPSYSSGHEERLKTSVRAIAEMLKSWPGLLTLSRNKAAPLRSLLGSLQYPTIQAKDLILELLFDVLRIKAPSWSSTFLAGRRLTTYGRGSHSRIEPAATKRAKPDAEHESRRLDLTSHFSTLVLATLLEAGLIGALTNMIRSEEDLALNRKATLLLTEVLRMANYCLPEPARSEIQVLGDLVTAGTISNAEEHAINAALIFQIESINRTLNRISSMTTRSRAYASHGDIHLGSASPDKSKLSTAMDTEQFRQAVADTLVPSHSHYIKWKWDLIHNIIEGPLTNSKRLEEVINSKFLERLTAFYRPFKYRFSIARNTRPNQRYVRIGCTLIKSLMQTAVGKQYLTDNKLFRQVAECMAQVDRLSGLTSTTPFFDRVQMVETLSGGYFAMVGVLSQTVGGIQMMAKWHMINMFYHIIDLKDREDLVETILGNVDFSLDSHLRVLLSKALTAGSKEIRIFATKLLRRYAINKQLSMPSDGCLDSRWVLNLLLTQLYDPDVEVCEIAVKNLEEACNRRSDLEYVVKCRPSLDHLGEIGAPLLLRFLSTSIGYHYLDGLDYITQEMDDWFLGRNDTYVTLVEASLARAYIEQPNHRNTISSADDALELEDLGIVPPHFYRELARTEEGCRLLEKSGHFHDFASVVRGFELDEEDGETLTKIKGCLWAIGNVGSMELGARFLEETEIVGSIVRIAEGAEVMSLRGTAFFVLGLMSRSKHGNEMLLELGWQSAVDEHGRSLGLCLPEQLGKLCSVRDK